MKDQAHEQISALLDGELDTREHEFLLSRLERDHESQGRLDRYAVIGAAIRNELPAHEPI
ncbi:MAG: RseA family anti-sigma factor, partial [Gammaproteobacteria bacterium]